MSFPGMKQDVVCRKGHTVGTMEVIFDFFFDNTSNANTNDYTQREEEKQLIPVRTSVLL